jgi:hypothetical protein
MLRIPFLSRTTYIGRRSFHLSWLGGDPAPMVPTFRDPPIFSGLITYPLWPGEIATHHLTLLCSQNRVLIVATDQLQHFPCQRSITNSIEYFVEEVLKRFHWINNVGWDVVECSHGGTWTAVTFKQETDSKRGRVRLSEPEWLDVDITPVKHLLAIRDAVVYQNPPLQSHNHVPAPTVLMAGGSVDDRL